jgi:hypothetical protein
MTKKLRTAKPPIYPNGAPNVKPNGSMVVIDIIVGQCTTNTEKASKNRKKSKLLILGIFGIVMGFSI